MCLNNNFPIYPNISNIYLPAGQTSNCAHIPGCSSVYPCWPENKTSCPNPLLLVPAVFGGLAAFSLGFGFFGHNLSGGYSKFIFFLDVYAIISTFSVGYLVFHLIHYEAGAIRYTDIIIPIIILTLFYATVYNFIYSLYPGTFSGTIGNTPITQFLSFTAKSIGIISIGESFNVTAEDTGVQILTAIEALFNFFVITLLFSLLLK
jgi:hypothetical protein